MPPDSQDPYTYPNSTVLRNKFGTRSANKLARLEYAATAARLDEMRRWPPADHFDLETLTRLHGHIFQDVYDWAGSIRTVDIAKAGQKFCRPAFLESEGNGRATREFFRQLAKQAGYEFDLTKIERGAWNEASARSFKGDTKPLRDVLAAAIRPDRAA